jgi:hypothetical protein
MHLRLIYAFWPSFLQFTYVIVLNSFKDRLFSLGVLGQLQENKSQVNELSVDFKVN